MSISREQVINIASLARIAIEKVDIGSYQGAMSDILDFVGHLDAADTTDIEPMAHPLDLVQRLREDVVGEENRRDDFQAIAPETEQGLYLVPRVIE